MSAEALAWPAPEAVDALVAGRHGDPFAVLGMHSDGARLRLAAWVPEASSLAVVDAATGQTVADLPRIRIEGFFAGEIGRRRKPFAYRLRAAWADDTHEFADPYAFPPLLGELDSHLVGEGRHRDLYRKMGAHPMELGGVSGTAFAVWAPNARRVSVIGDFNLWDERRHPMRKRVESGVWELFLPGVDEGALYKFHLLGPEGEVLPSKADPFSLAQETPPATASRIHGELRHDWQDKGWLAARAERDARTAPMSIYEVHLGSWRRRGDGTWLDYDELADTLVPYARDMGFTHIELLPISEHPFTGSWGYQPIGLFAPTARHGAPEGFARFVDRCHAEEIGLLVDWVPAHFPTDVHGLARFDGTALYEHADPRQGFQPDWNTLIYNLGRREVANFLEANAIFWLDRYHVDGLRVDAVASMLYLDYSREPDEWVPNIHGGNENLDAIAFLRETNSLVRERHPGALTIAEESTAWPQVSRPVEVGGLGFGFKWNMGWMHDTLDFMAHDPVHRRYHHHQLTFGLLYAFSENFVLPLSHDEVVHGKRSLLGRMPGDRWQQFANLRAYYGFMWGHPGKKLIFMGGEFAQGIEWNHDAALEWQLLDDPFHRGVQLLVRDLNELHRTLPALHQRDCDPSGFQWIDANNADQSVLSFVRCGEPGAPQVLVVCNFTPIVRRGYRVGVPQDGRWIERLNSDASCYGGSNVGNGGAVMAEAHACHGRDHSVLLTLPPLATVIFEHAPGDS